MHAFFADGVDKMHIPWAVEGLPTLLHLSLFLFFSGLAIFLYNVDREVFMSVVWWIGLFTLVYGSITLLPLVRHNSPYYSPLSKPVWFPYTSTRYVTFKVLTFIAYHHCSYETWKHYRDLRDRYRGRLLWGVEKAAEEMASELSSEIDVRILGWTISALGDDDSLEKFFEAIPGFFHSELVKDLGTHFPETLLNTFWGALDGFMGRTESSNSVTESVKSRRVLICRDITGVIPCPHYYMHGNLRSHFDQASVSIERLQAMARWFTHSSDEVPDTARISVARNLLKIQERDNRWITLASDAYGLEARDIEHNVALGGDNVLLAFLIRVSRQAIHSYKKGMLGLVEPLNQIDIRHTTPGLQNDFCAAWNELVKEARNRRFYSISAEILHLIRHLYISLHQGTDVSLTAFSASTPNFDDMFKPPPYPLCDIASHRYRPDSITPILITQPAHSPDASSHRFTSGGSTVSRPVEEASNIARLSPPDPTTRSEIGDSSQVPATTLPALPVHTSPRPTDASRPGSVATALQDIPPAATLSLPLEGTAQHDIVAPCTEPELPDIGEIMSTASTPAPTPTLTPVPPLSTPPVLNTTLTSCDAGVASTSTPFLPASPIVSFSTPASPPPSRVPPLLKTPSHPTGNTTLPSLRARGLVNSGNICFANAVLHLLVHSPPFWNLFRELGDLKGQRGAGVPETGAGTTLVDATVRFFEEFMFKGEPPTTQQPLQLTTTGKQREDEEEKKENKVVDSFEPTYIYDAMKEKRQLKILLVRSHAQDALLYY
jgi:hypothetical protein